MEVIFVDLSDDNSVRSGRSNWESIQSSQTTYKINEVASSIVDIWAQVHVEAPKQVYTKV